MLDFWKLELNVFLKGMQQKRRFWGMCGAREISASEVVTFWYYRNHFLSSKNRVFWRKLIVYLKIDNYRWSYAGQWWAGLHVFQRQKRRHIQVRGEVNVETYLIFHPIESLVERRECEEKNWEPLSLSTQIESPVESSDYEKKEKNWEPLSLSTKIESQVERRECEHNRGWESGQQGRGSRWLCRLWCGGLLISHTHINHSYCISNHTSKSSLFVHHPVSKSNIHPWT